jgi:hypothetical protein
MPPTERKNKETGDKEQRILDRKVRNKKVK